MNTESPSPTSRNLAEALEAYEIDVPHEQQDRLSEFCRLMWDWNEKINLTRHNTFDLFVARDLIDSIQLSAVLEDGERILDVGTGGGVPGLVLSILRPDLDVSVCDSMTKKAKVVGDIAASMKLPVNVARGRAEELLETTSFDSLTARAVGSMRKMLGWFHPHWESMGRLLLIKGPKWIEERGEARHFGLLTGMQLRKLTSYTIPGCEWESVILSISPEGRD